MTRGTKPASPPFSLGMEFAEALERFALTDPKEVADSVARAKQKKPPGVLSPRRRTSESKVKVKPGSKRVPDDTNR